VPIALYDLAYHVGIATRLLPEGDFRASLATFDRISAEFGADQVALLRRFVALVDDRDQAALESAIAQERVRLAVFDRALVAACDRAVLDVAAEVSRITRSEAKPHMRSKLLGAVAFDADRTRDVCDEPSRWLYAWKRGSELTLPWGFGSVRWCIGCPMRILRDVR